MHKFPTWLLFDCKEFDTESAKLEKDIKKIFYKNNCHKLTIAIKVLLGECDLPSQKAAIVNKQVEMKTKNTVIKFFNDYRPGYIYSFFHFLFSFFLFFCLNIFLYKSGV